MIHFLRNSTQLSRFSRMEVRDFIERLDAEGYAIAKKDEIGFQLPDLREQVQVVEPAAVIDV
jgi:biotin operon repressor